MRQASGWYISVSANTTYAFAADIVAIRAASDIRVMLSNYDGNLGSKLGNIRLLGSTYTVTAA